MASTYDTFGRTSGAAVTSLTTPSFTITSSANRCAHLVVAVHPGQATNTNFSASVAGTAATLVTNGDSGTVSNNRAIGYFVIAPASGSQTATSSWTGSATGANLSVQTASSVDQTTGMNNGTAARGGSLQSLTITTTSGDLTVSAYRNNKTTQMTCTNMTVKFNGAGSASDTFGGAAGPGNTSSDVHNWDGGGGGSSTSASGANFVQAAGAARTTKNTRSAPLGMEIGMDWRSDL